MISTISFMQYTVKQSLIEKSFQKIGSQIGDDLDLTPPESQVDFMIGVITSMEKDAHMNPSQALGMIKFLVETGYNNSLANKTASIDDGNELDKAFDEMNEKIAGMIIKNSYWITDPRSLMQPVADHAAEAGGRAAVQEGFKQFGDMANNAFNKIKDPEFLKTIAPYAIGAIGGYAIPRLLGGGGNGLVNAGLGAAAVGGGAYLANKYKLTDPETWKGFKDKAMNFIGSVGQPKQ